VADTTKYVTEGGWHSSPDVGWAATQPYTSYLCYLCNSRCSHQRPSRTCKFSDVLLGYHVAGFLAPYIYSQVHGYRGSREFPSLTVVTDDWEHGFFWEPMEIHAGAELPSLTRPLPEASSTTATAVGYQILPSISSPLL
jgi:hypothetical protein